MQSSLQGPLHLPAMTADASRRLSGSPFCLRQRSPNRPQDLSPAGLGRHRKRCSCSEPTEEALRPSGSSCRPWQTQQPLQQRRRLQTRLSGPVALLQALAHIGSAAAVVSPAKEALRPTQAKASPSKDAIHFHQQPKKVSRLLSGVIHPDSRSWVQPHIANNWIQGPRA